MNSIGTKAIRMIAGAWRPIPLTSITKPNVAAMLYAGAVEATAITRFER